VILAVLVVGAGLLMALPAAQGQPVAKNAGWSPPPMLAATAGHSRQIPSLKVLSAGSSPRTAQHQAARKQPTRRKEHA
jgi:hypothetical protein